MPDSGGERSREPRWRRRRQSPTRWLIVLPLSGLLVSGLVWGATKALDWVASHDVVGMPPTSDRASFGEHAPWVLTPLRAACPLRGGGWPIACEMLLSVLNETAGAMRTGGALGRERSLRVEAVRLLEARLDGQRAEEQHLLGVHRVALADVELLMGRLAPAREAFEAAAVMLVDDAAHLDWWAMCQYGLGEVGLRLGDLDRATDAHRRALKARRALAGREPDNRVYREALHESLLRTGFALSQTGHTEQSRQLWQEAETRARRVRATEPDDDDARLALATALAHLSESSRASGEVERAVTRGREAAALTASSLSKQPGDPSAMSARSMALDAWGNAESARGAAGTAGAIFEQALALDRQRVEHAPEAVVPRKELAIGLAKVAEFEAAGGNATTARRLLLESLAVRRTLAEELPSDRSLQEALAGGLVKLATVEVETSLSESDRHRVRQHLREAVGIAGELASRGLDMRPINADAASAMLALGRSEITSGAPGYAWLTLAEARDLLIPLVEYSAVDDAYWETCRLWLTQVHAYRLKLADRGELLDAARVEAEALVDVALPLLESASFEDASRTVIARLSRRLEASLLADPPASVARAAQQVQVLIDGGLFGLARLLLDDSLGRWPRSTVLTALRNQIGRPKH